jgi:hypothetical protein
VTAPTSSIAPDGVLGAAWGRGHRGDRGLRPAGLCLPKVCVCARACMRACVCSKCLQFYAWLGGNSLALFKTCLGDGTGGSAAAPSPDLPTHGHCHLTCRRPFCVPLSPLQPGSPWMQGWSSSLTAWERVRRWRRPSSPQSQGCPLQASAMTCSCRQASGRGSGDSGPSSSTSRL